MPGDPAPPPTRASPRAAPAATRNAALAPRIFALGALLIVHAGCASTQQGPVQFTAGRASRIDVTTKVEALLVRKGYVIQERRDSGNLIQYTTSWTSREPFQDEKAQGATQVRTKVIIEARQGSAGMFSVSLRAENSSWGASGVSGDGEWAVLAPTQMFRESMQELSSAIGLEVDAGLRVR